MADFKLVSNFQPSGDQPEAIKELVSGINDELKYDFMIETRNQWNASQNAHVRIIKRNGNAAT